VLVVHPHVPPPVTARHAVPVVPFAHTSQDVPPVPHAPTPVPPTQVGVAWVVSQHPPLHGFTEQFVEQRPLTPHAEPRGQSLAFVHPQATPVQTWPFVFVEQSMHVAPAAPHALGVPPPHVPVLPLTMLQHDPVHAWLAEHVVVHVRGVPVAPHAAPASPDDAQSLALAHPQAPPPVTAMHLVPTLSPAHVPHAVPPVPQASSAAPLVHEPDAQQPPLHASPTSHVVEHWCAPLHACPTGQSLALAQPHVPPFGPVTHAAPASPAHPPHIAPPKPQCAADSVVSHVVALQHVPLQL
jgi:hypothetical protein